LRVTRRFGDLYVSMVRAGETGGVLEECLLRVADQLEKDAALRRQVRSAMVYPALITTFAVGVLLALVAFLIPVFEGVFKQFGGKLPALTQIMVDVSHLVTKQWYLLIVFLVGGIGFFLWVRKSKWARPRRGAFTAEPLKTVMSMFVGGIVGVIVVSMYLPLFNIYNQIK
jgi:type IV pilus assembly protein PilC